MATKKSSPASDAAPSSSTETVLVEGSVTPAVGYLKRGKQAVVLHTPLLNDLVSKGFIDIVKVLDAGDVPAKPITPGMPQGTNNDLVQVDPVAPPKQPTTTLPGTVTSGTNQDLVEATPVDPGNQDLVEVGNPAVDNTLVDPNA